MRSRIRFHQDTAGLVKFRLDVGGVNQDARVDDQHLLAAFHHVVERISIGNIHEITTPAKLWERWQFFLARFLL